ncbi:MAG: hypothetical protein GY804_04655 [Alphaproteobacteria bacterium]|nr:hypothetical protein [Alphaproteobacteria bacterium]
MMKGIIVGGEFKNKKYGDKKNATIAHIELPADFSLSRRDVSIFEHELTNDRTAIELLTDIKNWDIAQAVKLEIRVKLSLPVDLRARIQDYLSRADL